MAAEELEADFGRYYPHVDFLDVYRPGVGMTLRRAAVYAANLPPGSATRRRLGGPGAWTDEMHLLAPIEHGIRVLAWQQTEDGKHGRKVPEPIEPPPLLHEQQETEERELAKARRFRARQERRAARARQQNKDPTDGR